MAPYKYDLVAARKADPNTLVIIERTCDNDVVKYTADNSNGKLVGIEVEWTRTGDPSYHDAVSQAALKYFYAVKFVKTLDDKVKTIHVKILSALNEFCKDDKNYAPIHLSIKLKKKKSKIVCVLEGKKCTLDAISVDMDMPPKMAMRSVTLYGIFVKNGEEIPVTRVIQLPAGFVDAQGINPMDFL